MKISDLLTEGISFSPMRLQDNTWSAKDFGRWGWSTCPNCNGTGNDPWRGYICDQCDGERKIKTWISDAPDLNVSNSNGFALLKMLNLPADYTGVVEHQDLPELMRQIIRLKNKNLKQYSEPSRIERGSMKVDHDPETNLPRIQKGATVYHMGRTENQIEIYLERLINIIKFAQQNEAALVWT